MPPIGSAAPSSVGRSRRNGGSTQALGSSDRDVERGEQLVVPAPAADVVGIVRDALLTSVTCSRPPGELPGGQLSIVPNASSPRRAACARPARGQKPADLRAREVRVDEPGAPATVVAGPTRAIACRSARCAGPARRSRCGSAGRWRAPDHRGLALVGDADTGDRARVDPRGGQRLARGRELRVPDLDRRARPSQVVEDLPEPRCAIDTTRPAASRRRCAS